MSRRDLAQIIEGTLGFQPTRVRSSEFCKNGSAYKPNHLAKLAELENVSSLQLETDAGMNGVYLHFATLGAWGFHVLYWKDTDLQESKLTSLHAIAQREGFTAGFCSDADYVFWQSVESINTYELHKRPTEHLPKILDRDFGRDKIDISKNPGRRTAFPGMWLQTAWRMWFGPKSFEFLPPEKLMTFSRALQREVLPNGAIFIELPERPTDAETSPEQNVHRSFRDWMTFDQLEKRAGDFVARKDDPSTEIIRGHFPHGGVWLITQWYDGSGDLARRSLATSKKTVEFDGHFKSIWSSDILPC